MAKMRNLPSKWEKGFLQKMDFRTDLAKRLTYAFDAVVDDCGGLDAMPYVKVALAERFAFMEEFLRQIERELVKGPVANADLIGKWTQAVNAMSGLAKTLGLSRSKIESAIDVYYASEDDPDTPPNGESAKEGKDTHKTKRARTSEARAREKGER